MSSYSSSYPPSTPTFGIFPTSPSGPHAFASMQQSPRDSHSMYAALGTNVASQGATKSGQPSPTGTGTFSKLTGRK
ncbi:hypothetical protein NEOLEDRAFT_1060229 [Neolentinus lepideus HHB14362 ss-1]|uniref:Uncharacterized protein n=1 Tax=Neolentinus lepideus HHB14362 ss-1 TaxID=1314782 RepID=A0A165U5D2_9AGAM|nr:hypothetical protein NEOLEDRAFT_1060229 [Neolentinus lepideus HHB14362 ss-1]